LEITIQESRLSFRSKYEIETPGSFYYAQKAFFSWPPRLTLQSSDERDVATLLGRFSFFRNKYDFVLRDGRIFHFYCQKRWKRVFMCEGGTESYCIYGHKGLRYSVFQSDCQIAAFTKNRIVIGKGNRYDVSLNDDADLLVLMCIVLAINTSENDDDDTTVTIDIGSIGPEEKPFDSRWQPS